MEDDNEVTEQRATACVPAAFAAPYGGAPEDALTALAAAAHIPLRLLNGPLPAVGQVGRIPLGLIRPFAGQPRRWFDPVELQILADSIKAEGQRTPAWVMPVHDGAPTHDGALSIDREAPAPAYELVAGERRWRACALVGIPTLLCEVRAPLTAAAQYIDSVMENFGRQDCTVLEASRAVAEVLRLRRGGATPTHYSAADVDAVARVFARSGAWVRQRLQLLRLHPDVLKLLEPPQRLLTQVALALAGLPPETQVELANAVVGRKMRWRSALSYVRTAGAPLRSKRVEGRRRADDVRNLHLLLRVLGERAEHVLTTQPGKLRAMLQHRSVEELSTLRAVLNRRAGELRAVADAVGALVEEKTR